MASEIVHDVLDLELETLEIDETGTPSPCYPYPPLRKTGRKATISIRTAVLSNAYLQATIALDLGGRLIQLFDRRTRTDILPPLSQLVLREGGPRGVEAPFGLEILVNGHSRNNSLGPVEHILIEPEDESEPARLVIWEQFGGRSFHATYSLFPDECALELEVKDYSRPGQSNQEGPSGLGFFTNGSTCQFANGCGILNSEGNGIACFYENLTFDGVIPRANGLTLERGVRDDFPIKAFPGSTDTWRAKIYPVSLGAKPLLVSPLLSLGLDGSELIIQSARDLDQSKLFVNTSAGTVEARMDIRADRAMKMSLAELIQPREVLLRDANKEEIGQSSLTASVFDAPAKIDRDPMFSREELAILAIRNPGSRGSGLLALAQAANRRGEASIATSLLDECLNYAADDALAWWFKAALERNDPEFEPDNERAALLNAHFLAPLEPMLRAEAVLSTPVGNPEPSPLMKPLIQNPEALTDVVCLLIDCGFKQDATRLMMEAFKHENIFMLRILQAWLLLEGTRLDADAAEQLAQAEKAQLRPPYPWREMEFTAIRDLSEKFPNHPAVLRVKNAIQSLSGHTIKN